MATSFSTNLTSLIKAGFLAIRELLGYGANQLTTLQSVSSIVEEDSVVNFAISLSDFDDSDIPVADIDITAISAVLYKSTGGAAYTSALITQPTFAKIDGLVFCDYRFLAAEWVNGDMYKLLVSGISATVHTVTAYVPKATWSNIILESANVETKIDGIQTDVTALAIGSLEIEADAGTTATNIIDAASLTQATADWFKGATVISINGQNTGQARPIVKFTVATDSIDVYPAFLNTPDAGDDFLIISSYRSNVLSQQPDVAINTNANIAAVDIFDLNTAGLTYMVNNLIIKSADPGANTVTLTLYEIVNDASVVVDTFDITTANYTNYFSLYDMFSRHHLSGEDIQITLTCDADGNHVVTGQYSFSECYTG